MRRCLFAATVFCSLLPVTAPAGAQVSYQVSVDTSPLANTTGFIDFQFNPGGNDAQAATVQVTGFTLSGGLLAPTSADIGAAAGTLPQTLVIGNGGAFNDVFQGITYGTSLSFTASFSGPALTPPPNVITGSTFVLGLYAGDGVTPLLTTDPSGSLADVELNGTGTTTPTTFPDINGTDYATISATGPNPVPEASTAATTMVGLLVLLALVWGAKSRRVRRDH